MGDMTITLRPGCVELRGTIRTADDLQKLIDRLKAISDWMEIDGATRRALDEATHDR